jgi:GDP-L-fucose synthase
MPTNLYGPGDNYDLQKSHVLPALLRKFYEAKENNSPSVTIWGSGTPRREFLHVDDAAAAGVFLMLNYESPAIINIGSGEDHSIREMAEMIKDISGYPGVLVFDESKPDGTMRKLMDVSRINGLGWKHGIDLREGLERTYREFEEQYEKYVGVPGS